MLKRVGDRRHPCLTPTVVLNHSSLLPFIWTALVTLPWSYSMVRTRFALILYFRMVAHKAACHTLLTSKAFLKLMKTWYRFCCCLRYFSVMLLPALYPACSSAIISSAWGLSLFKMTFSMTLLEWLMRLIDLQFWQSCKMPFLGNVIISDWVHGVGHPPVLQILLQISVKTSIVVSPAAWTSSSGILSTPADFHFFNDTVALSTSSWRIGCSSVLRCHHNSHSCTALSNILCICWGSRFFVRHFPDLSWIVEDLPCFSEVRSFTSWYALLLLFLFRQVSISSHWAPIQSSFALLTAFWILLFASLNYFAPSASYRFFFKFLLSSQRSRTSLVTHGFFLRHYCCMVGGNHGINVHVLISQSSEGCKLSTGLSLLEKWKPHLGPTASQDQTLVLAGLAFSQSSDEFERSSPPGHGLFLCLLQENSLSYGC